MKKEQTKVYVLMLSKEFPKEHPNWIQRKVRAGVESARTSRRMYYLRW